jgi:hypothetical protein
MPVELSLHFYICKADRLVAELTGKKVYPNHLKSWSPVPIVIGIGSLPFRKPTE